MEIQRVVPNMELQKRYPLIDQAVKNAIRDAQFQKFRQERAKEHVHGENCKHHS